jgi:hypothetical protein
MMNKYWKFNLHLCQEQLRNVRVSQFSSCFSEIGSDRAHCECMRRFASFGTTHVIHCIITNFACLSGNKFTNWCPSFNFFQYTDIREVNLVYPIHNGSCYKQQMINNDKLNHGKPQLQLWIDSLKVNIYPFPLPHFASIFFAYLWSFRWPNYIVTLPRYFSFRLPHLNIDTGPPCVFMWLC